MLSSLFDIYTEALDKNRSRSVANSGHRYIKWDTSSASTEHKGQRSFRFLQPLEVDKTFMSILSLVNKNRILGFLFTFIYTGYLKSTDNSHKVTKRLDALIKLYHLWINWSFKRNLNSLWNCAFAFSGHNQITPKPFEDNIYWILCTHIWLRWEIDIDIIHVMYYETIYNGSISTQYIFLMFFFQV